jgi:imidazolonepropionase-like amidohydrolase
MLVRDGRVAVVGTYLEIKKQLSARTEIVDAAGRVVTPGFVDAHTHLVFAGNRADDFEQRIAGATYQEIAAAGGGIQSTVAKTRAATEDALLDAARIHLRWMLRSGTTTLEAKSGYGLQLESELKTLRVVRHLDKEGPQRIVPTVLAAHTVPREYREDRAAYLTLVMQEILPAVAEQKRWRRRGPSLRGLQSWVLDCASMPSSFMPMAELSWRRNLARQRRTIWNVRRRTALAHCGRRGCSRCCCRRQYFRLGGRNIPTHAA